MQDPIPMGSWGNSSEEILAQQFPLHRACRDGDVEKVSALLGYMDELGPSNGLFQEDAFYGWTPAHWAAYFGKLPCLVRLIEQGEVSCNISTFRFHQSPLHIAAFGGHGHCVQWLLQRGSQINRQLACLRKVILLGELHGVPVSKLTTSRFDQTLCHLAAFAGHPQCLSWLIQATANVSSQDYLGETPLHKAARTGSMECVSLLVSQGASLSNTNFSGQTPSQLAMMCNFPECAQYLDRAAELQKPPRGIFQDMLPAVTHAPPLDPSKYRLPDNQKLAIISQGLNGGTIPHHNKTNGISHDMEEDSMDTDDSATNTHHSANGFNGSCGRGDAASNGDVLLLNGVCTNRVPVAGRKRGREEVDAECLKKIRTGEMEISREQQICVDGVEAVTILPQTFVNPNYGRMNNVVQQFGNPNLNQNGAGKVFTSPSWHSMNGSAPNFINPNSGKMNGNHFNGAVSEFINPNFGKMNEAIRQVEVPTFGQITNPGHVTSNDLLQSSVNVPSNGVMGGRLWSQGTRGNMENLSNLGSVTNSVLEHRSTVNMQQGYDSLIVDSLIANTHGQ